MSDSDDARQSLEALRPFGPVLAIKLYRLTLDPAPTVPTLPCLDHEAMLHATVAPHAVLRCRCATSCSGATRQPSKARSIASRPLPRSWKNSRAWRRGA